METKIAKEPREYEKQGLTSVEYRTIHKYICKHNKKAGTCSHCGNSEKRTVWALITGRLYSKDISDYIELCDSCHGKYDFADWRRDLSRETAKVNFGDKRHNLGSKGIKSGASRKIIQLNINGDVIRYWDSLIDVGREIPGFNSANISRVVTGRNKTAYGFKWIYDPNQKNKWRTE